MAIALAVRMDETDALNLFRKFQTTYVCRRVRFDVPCNPLNIVRKGTLIPVLEISVTDTEKIPQRAATGC